MGLFGGSALRRPRYKKISARLVYMIEEKIRKKFDDGELAPFDRGEITVNGSCYEFYAEGWNVICFEEEELERYTNHELEHLAFEKAGEIAEREDWEDFVYVPPMHDATFGVTVFYKEN